MLVPILKKSLQGVGEPPRGSDGIGQKSVISPTPYSVIFSPSPAFIYTFFSPCVLGDWKQQDFFSPNGLTPLSHTPAAFPPPAILEKLHKSGIFSSPHPLCWWVAFPLSSYSLVFFLRTYIYACINQRLPFDESFSFPVAMTCSARRDGKSLYLGKKALHLFSQNSFFRGRFF